MLSDAHHTWEGMKLILDIRAGSLCEKTTNSNTKWVSVKWMRQCRGSPWWWEESRVGTVAELP